MPYRLRIFFRGVFKVIGESAAFQVIGKAANLVYGQLTSWVVGNITLQQGQGQSFNVAATGPSGYTAGGVYDAVSGANLPSGLTLSASGTLTDSGASAGTTSGVIFGYTEPGALPVLTLNTGAAIGTLPYMATVYPTEGAVPSGKTLSSPEDSTLRASVLSAWPDGSAQIMVVAGQYTFAANNQIQPINLRVSNTLSGSNLTPAFLASLFSANAIQVNFGTLLTLTSTQLANNYDRIWWQNPAVICARYRLPITNKGSMEAVIDVHAFAGGRAFVEVVIENGKVSSSSPVNPGSQTYTNATVAVNGATIATVSSPTAGQSYGGNSGTYTGGHEAFRAWYCSTWVGGDPQIAVTHDTASLWAHPMLFRPAAASTYNYATQAFAGGASNGFEGVSQPYGSDTYLPWRTGRHRVPNMGAGGDDPSIGAFTAWDSRYIQSGDKNVRNAVINNALCVLSMNVNYRDQSTTEVLDPNAVSTRFRYDSTGSQSDNLVSTSTEPSWELAHQPEFGLIAFLCRPSPCFIELAQKAALWSCTYYINNNIYYQTRSRAWGMRNVGHAIFLTPDSQSWKSGGRTSYTRNVNNVTNYFKNIATNPLGVVVDSSSPTVATFIDHRSALGFQQSLWQHHFFSVIIHRASMGKILRGADQTTLDQLADWACAQPIRYVNEMPNGAWRYHRYETTIGTNNYGSSGNGAPMGQLSDWWSITDWWMTDTPPSVSGPWYVNGNGDDPPDQSFASVTFSVNVAANAGLNYVELFWMALCAGVERNISGADTAWTTVYGTSANGNVTGLATWLAGFASDTRQGHYPRNK
jgi:hypothetical protein